MSKCPDPKVKGISTDTASPCIIFLVLSIIARVSIAQTGEMEYISVNFVMATIWGWCTFPQVGRLALGPTSRPTRSGRWRPDDASWNASDCPEVDRVSRPAVQGSLYGSYGSAASAHAAVRTVARCPRRRCVSNSLSTQPAVTG